MYVSIVSRDRCGVYFLWGTKWLDNHDVMLVVAPAIYSWISDSYKFYVYCNDFSWFMLIF